jgi:hypothetical protein
MNYLVQIMVYIEGQYYTPKKVIDKITYECIIGNPPFKV